MSAMMSVVLHIVNWEFTKWVSTHEHRVGFLKAEDTTGKGLLDVLLGHLETLRLDILICCGQTYAREKAGGPEESPKT